MIFRNREHAGELLAEPLSQLNLNKKETIILAIPRGGVVVGSVLAKKMDLPLDIIVTRKLGAPGNPELAIGAINSHGGAIEDKELISKLGISKEYLASEQLKEREEAKRREEVFRRDKPVLELAGKTVILVDDGVATGSTMKATINSVRDSLPSKIMVAVPVAAIEIAEELRKEVDGLIVLATPSPFQAVGQFYENFPQVSDQEVIRFLKG